MSRTVPGLARQIPLGVIGLIALASWWAFAQQPGGSDTPRKRAADQKLILLVHFKASENRAFVPASEIKATLELGCEQSGCKTKDVRVRPISSQAYEDLKNLTSDLEEQPLAAADGKPRIVQRRVREKVIEWEFNLGDPGLHLGALELEFGKGEPRRTLELSNADDPKAALQETAQQGVYTVKLEPGKVPTKFRAYVERLGVKDRPPPIEGQWPATANYYYVTVLDGFEGNRDELLKTVQRPERVGGIRFTSVEVGSEYTFVFASIGSRSSSERGRFTDRNEYIPYVRNLDEGKPTRVWMLFPLSRDEANKQWQQLKAHDTRALPKEIRKSRPLLAQEHPRIEVGPGFAPQWIELPPAQEGDGFSRALQLREVRKLQEKFPDAWRLVVWEFDTGPSQIASPVLDPDDGGTYYVLRQPVKEWPEGIREAAGREGKARPAP